MRETDALFAGEHSGHYYFRDNYRADSGLIASLLLLEALSRHDGALSSLIKPYDVYVASGEVNSPVENAEAATERVLDEFTDRAEADWADGLDHVGRELVVQPPALEHRAALAVERRSSRRPDDVGDSRRGSRYCAVVTACFPRPLRRARGVRATIW